MKRMKGGVLALAITIAPGVSDLGAQQGFRIGRGLGVDGGRSGAEAIMNMRARLELTEDQINSLEALRRSTVERQNERFATSNELRSRLRAGQIERGDFNEAMGAQREASRALAAQQREQVESILSEEQIESLEQLRGRARAFARGRASAQRGRGGIRGNRTGIRGRPRPGVQRFDARGRFGPRVRGQRFPDRRGGPAARRSVRRGVGA